MVDRPNKPSALVATPGLPPQPQVTISHGNSRVTAALTTGESVEVLLFGATVLSWKDAAGDEKLWLSKNTNLDGSKGVRGGIPLVFPVFGPPQPNHAATSKLPQHGFVRTARWEFLGKSTSEGSSSSVKLDFGLSTDSIPESTKALWPYKFGLLYSVTLDRESLNTTLVITNDGDESFDCQMLLHTYFNVKNISTIQITGLEGSEYVDKVDGARTKTETSSPITFSSEADRVYTPIEGPKHPIVISDSGKTRFRISRDNLEQVVVWNPWVDKSQGMADFTPKDGYKNMVCVEAGSVAGWQKLDKGDTFEGAQTIYLC
ncbi:hypothetical protein QQS21_003203 [Conoideocrella luteorostrata]|uniref:Glucose-6-phosphate 1-epimerase n=1 Tax=Conoideocrella luteorostrata TaxID=1105319 RepID=A0AAJ0CW92_9HYPO|nr:hypothetical protein QQS21_003203 [Conoideocrella luteorostrata]